MVGSLELITMAYLLPEKNDTDWDLWRKAAWNWYNQALEEGATGLTPPRYGDNVYDLMKKCVYYTAFLS